MQFSKLQIHFQQISFIQQQWIQYSMALIETQKNYNNLTNIKLDKTNL